MYDTGTVLTLVKQRLNRAQGDTTLDEMLTARIQGAADELVNMGVALTQDSMADTMLLVDLSVWQYQNRDQATAQPPWLRQRLRNRWIHERRAMV